MDNDILSHRIIIKYQDGTEKRFGLTAGDGSSQGLMDVELAHEIARGLTYLRGIKEITLETTRSFWETAYKDSDDPNAEPEPDEEASGYHFKIESVTYHG